MPSADIGPSQPGGAREDSRLDALRRTGVLDTPAEESFDRLAALAARLLGVPVVFMSLIDADRQFFKSCVGLPEPWNSLRQTPLSHSFCRHVVATGQALVIENAREHPLVKDNPAIHDLGVVAYAGIPLTTVAGEVLGSFSAADSRPRSWSDDDLATLRTLAASASTELQLRRVANEHRAQRDLAAREGSLARIAERALRKTSDLFRAVIDGSSDAIFVKDADGRYVMVNAAGAAMVGRSVEQIVGRDDREIFDAETAARIMAADQEVIRAGAGREVEHPYVPLGGGKTLTLQTCKSPFRDETGNIVGVLGIARDVTLRKRAEEELTKAKEQAEAANSAKDRLLAVLSHELRSPLTPVLALASAWEGDESVAADLREDLSIIRRSVALEVRLIDDLLDMTRIVRGKLRLAAEPVDTHALVRYSVRTCSMEAVARKRLKLETDLRAVRPVILADAARMQQVLWNLLDNAVKFTPDDGRITVRTWDETGDTLAIEVADTGIGIDPQILPRVFDAFEQGDETVTDRFGGLGLGLAICNALVKSAGGQIAAASDGLGRGSSFKLLMPTYAPAGATPDAAAPRVDRKNASPATSARPLRILLVEDSVDTSNAIRRLLSRIGHQVRTAGTLRAAVDAARAGPVDLVISDLGLPDGSGQELMEMLKPFGPVRGIALSGYGSEEDIRKSHAAGFATHLTKPTDFQTLVDTIERIST